MISISSKSLEPLIGPVRVKPNFANKTNAVGIANGLAWTSVGGELLPIEVQIIENGSGGLELTGSLGDVMKESAKLAITYAKVHAAEYGFEGTVFKSIDIHIHAPEGAIPKDGPSAGVTLATALISALSGRPVRSDVAMTGEDHSARHRPAHWRSQRKIDGSLSRKDAYCNFARGQYAGPLRGG